MPGEIKEAFIEDRSSYSSGRHHRRHRRPCLFRQRQSPGGLGTGRAAGAPCGYDGCSSVRYGTKRLTDRMQHRALECDCHTSYQIMPTPVALEEAMRSKSADITVAPVFITSARNEDFDFSYPTLEAGLQIMVRETGETARTASPLSDMLRLMFSRTTVVWLAMAMLLVLIPAHLVWLLERGHQDGIISEPGLLSWHLSGNLLGDIDADHTGGDDAAPMARASAGYLLDVRRCRLCCVLHRSAHDGPDRRADSRHHRGPWVICPVSRSLP